MQSFQTRGQLFQFVITLSSLFLCSVIKSNHFAYPGAEDRDFGVDARRLLCPAGVAPGCDPENNPTSSRTLTHQRATTVTTATVYTNLWLDATSAEHAACEGTMKVLLAVATGK